MLEIRARATNPRAIAEFCNTTSKRTFVGNESYWENCLLNATASASPAS